MFNRMSGSLSKMLVIAAMVLLLMVPVYKVLALIDERQETSRSAVLEITEKWGRAQTVAGPVLAVPYRVRVVNEQNEVKVSTHMLYVLPEALDIQSVVNPKERHRGIFKVVVYNARVRVSGRFELADLAARTGINPEDILLSRANVLVGISDMRGLGGQVGLLWNGSALQVNPGLEDTGSLKSGFSSPAPMADFSDKYEFALDMTLNGSERLMYLPLGRQTTARMSSDWGTPSFTGQYLPETYEVGDKGFSSLWRLNYLNRNYGQIMKREMSDALGLSAFGTAFLIPVDSYHKTTRTAKYALLFICIAFVTFYLIEVLFGNRVHPVQYLIVGVALVVFYTLLLSLSEHMRFELAYLIASLALVAQVSLYTWSILASRRLALVVAGILGALYGYMFIVLHLEDYALLAGSVGVFVMLGLIMYVTRKVDWYGLAEGKQVIDK